MRCQIPEMMWTHLSLSLVLVRFFVAPPAQKSARQARLPQVPIASTPRDEESAKSMTTPHLSLTHHVLRAISPPVITAMPSHLDAPACSATRASMRRPTFAQSRIVPNPLFSTHMYTTRSTRTRSSHRYLRLHRTKPSHEVLFHPLYSWPQGRSMTRR